MMNNEEKTGSQTISILQLEAGIIKKNTGNQTKKQKTFFCIFAYYYLVKGKMKNIFSRHCRLEFLGISLTISKI